MALVQFSGSVSDIRGSIGGMTFSRNRGGAYIRNRTTPVNPSSQRQVDARSQFSAAMAVWAHVLTDYQRMTWTDYASEVPYQNSLGQQRYLSGQQRFIQAYTTVANAGGTVSSTYTASNDYTEAPSPIPPGLMFTFEGPMGRTVVVNQAVSAPGVKIGDKLHIHLGPLMSQSRFYFKGPYRFVGALTAEAVNVFPTGDDFELPYSGEPNLTSPFSMLPIMIQVVTADNRLSTKPQWMSYLTASE